MPFDINELTTLIQGVDKKLSDLRSEVEGKASATDVVEREKIDRMQSDLASALSEASSAAHAVKAADDRIADLEAKLNRPGGFGSSEAPDEHKSAFLAYMRDPKDREREQKLFDVQRKAADVRGTTGASGGYAVPEVIAQEIAQQIQDISPIRQIARVVTIGTPDYKELVSTNGFAIEWVGETGTRAQTNTPNLAEVAPTMGSISAKPQATVESLEDLFFDVASWLVASASEEFAIGEGAAFISGNGTNKPTGFLTGTPVATADASRAFGVLQYVATGAAATLGTNPFDGLVNLMFGLKSGYRGNGAFVMNSATMANLARVKDADGRYLLVSSIAEGVPFSMLGRPVIAAEDMPDVAANAFPIAFGDFSRGYLVVDRSGLRIVRDEVTQPGYVKWIISRRVGGKVKDSNAIKLLKVAAS